MRSIKSNFPVQFLFLAVLMTHGASAYVCKSSVIIRPPPSNNGRERPAQFAVATPRETIPTSEINIEHTITKSGVVLSLLSSCLLLVRTGVQAILAKSAARIAEKETQLRMVNVETIALCGSVGIGLVTVLANVFKLV